MREALKGLAPMLWEAGKTMEILLLELTHSYERLTPPTLTDRQSMRVCNVLALMECLACHAKTRPLFLDAKLTDYIFPFLHTQSMTLAFVNLRINALSVFSGLLQVRNT